MTRTLLFIAGILAFLIFAFFYLNSIPPSAPGSLDDATKEDRCAEFREYDPEDGDIYSLGYEGRIRQLLSGCF